MANKHCNSFDEYQLKALETKAPGDMKRDMLHAAIGLSGEIAELRNAELLFDLKNEREEVGDACWYVAIALAAGGMSMQHLMTQSFSLGPYPNKNATNIDILVIESGEFLDLVKKWEFYGKEPTVDSVLNSLKWVLNSLHRRAGHRLDTYLLEICDDNIEKLQQKRFKSGKFTPDEAINRDLDAERKVFDGQ